MRVACLILSDLHRRSQGVQSTVECRFFRHRYLLLSKQLTQQCVWMLLHPEFAGRSTLEAGRLSLVADGFAFLLAGRTL